MIAIGIGVFLIIVVFCLLLGNDLANPFFKGAKLSEAERPLLSFALGLAFLGFVVFVMGKLKILFPSALVGLSILYVLTYGLRKILKPTPKKSSPANFLATIVNHAKKMTILEKVITVINIVFLILCINVALAPEVGFDSLWYHLEIPKTYLREHAVVFFSSGSMLSPSAVMPRLTDLMYTYMMSFGFGDLLPKLTHVTFLVLTSGLLYLFVFKISKDRLTALIAMLFLLLMQPLQWLAGTAYIDLASLFYGSLTFYFFYFYYKEDKKDNLILTAALCGICLAIKLWNLILLPIYMLFILIKNRRLGEMFKFFAIAFIFVLPFFTEAYLLTGNPIFPVLSISDADHLSGATDIRDWLLHVHPRTFFLYICRDYLLYGMMIVFLPLMFLFRDLLKKYSFMIIFSLIFLFLWSYIPVHEFRYGLAGLFALVTLISLTVKKISEQALWLKIVAFFAIFVYSLFDGFLFVRANENRIPAALTKASREAYLAKEIGNNKFSYYDSSGKIKEAIGDKKALVFAHNMFYVDFDYYDITRLEKELSSITNRDELLHFLEENEYDYLVFRGDYSMKQFLELIPNVATDQRWLDKHFTLIEDISSGPTRLYKINFI